jgi:hypothetical protein
MFIIYAKMAGLNGAQQPITYQLHKERSHQVTSRNQCVMDTFNKQYMRRRKPTQRKEPISG